MATAPPHLPDARRRASAVRRFPPGCGRQHRNAAAPSPRRPVPTLYAANGDPPPTPSARAAAAKTSSRLPGTDGLNRGRGDEPMARTEAPAAAEVVFRRLSAVRRYPPGCGRGVAVPKPGASALEFQGEGGAMELLAAVCGVQAEAIGGDHEVVMSASTLGNGETSSDGEGKRGGVGGGGALEGCGSSPGPPCTVTGITLAPLVPWAQHGQRSQQRRKAF